MCARCKGAPLVSSPNGTFYTLYTLKGSMGAADSNPDTPRLLSNAPPPHVFVHVFLQIEIFGTSAIAKGANFFLAS